MSNAARNWAKAQTVGNGVAKAVLLELADCANERGECWPSIGAICRVIEHQRNAVRDGIKALIKLRLVKRQERKTTAGGTLSPLWRLSLGGVSAERMNGHADGEGVEIAPPSEIAAGEGVEIAPGGGAKAHRGRGAKSHPNPSLDTKEIPKTPLTHTDPDPPPRARVREEEEEAKSRSGQVVRLHQPQRAIWSVGDPPGWERFKAAWPAIDGSWRVAALDYRQALAEGVDPDVLCEAAERYPFRRGWGTRYVVHPTTWLRERRWETEIATEPEPESLEELQRQALAEQQARAGS